MELEQIAALAASQRRYWESGATRPVEVRLAMLDTLRARMQQMEGLLLDALRLDLGKAPMESYETELGMVYSEIANARKHLKSWARVRRVSTPLAHFPSVSRVYPEPYGVALIISPWNYPLQLTLSPLVSALAAGNCAVLKPSSYSPNVSHALSELLSCFTRDLVAVVEGGRQENQALLRTKFDLIFFTGGAAVGREVMRAAADQLTPVVLELGGKSPCLVEPDVNLSLAARRILWGKMLNSGQTCVAPDYLLVHESVHDRLMDALIRRLEAVAADALNDENYPRIVNRKHFLRLTRLLTGQIAWGGKYDEGRLKISPTLIDHVDWEHPAMQEEIFGPILPVVTYADLSLAIREINARPRPLALYLFTKDAGAQRQVLEQVPFGGGCINDTLVHLATPYLPFGGVGESGMGAYHGKAGFDTFTHQKGVLEKKCWLDVPARYPPYTALKESLVRKLFK